jgi:hypothetical protein
MAYLLTDKFGRFKQQSPVLLRVFQLSGIVAFACLVVFVSLNGACIFIIVRGALHGPERAEESAEHKQGRGGRSVACLCVYQKGAGR